MRPFFCCFFLWVYRILCSHFYYIINSSKICIFIKIEIIITWTSITLLYFNHFNCPLLVTSRDNILSSNWNIPIFSFHFTWIILILVKTLKDQRFHCLLTVIMLLQVSVIVILINPPTISSTYRVMSSRYQVQCARFFISKTSY